MKTSRLLTAGVFCLLFVFSFARGQNRLTIDAMINGKKAVFALDTGTNLYIVLFRQTVEKFNLDVTEKKQKEFANFELEMGKSIYNAEAIVIDSPPVDVDGLIGWPFLKGKIWAVLWNEGTLVRLQSVPEQASGWMRINIAKDVPILAFSYGKKDEGLIFIDTGDSGGVSLSAARWKQWLREHPDAPMTLYAAWSPAVGGISVVRQSWSDQLELGALTIPGATVNRAAHKWPRLGAVVGLEALSHFEVVLDLKESRMYLKMRDGGYIESEYNRLGATFAPESLDSEELVARVLEDSPGYRFGIRNGDILLRVDDVDMTKWREYPDIWKRSFWTAKPGTQYNLELRRNGKRIELQVTLEEIFPIGRNKEKYKKNIQKKK
jgi:hypothetical protein